MLLALLLALSLSAAQDATCCNEFIVKTADFGALKGFASGYGIEVAPFITYPNPSDEVLELFGDYYLVTIPGGGRVSVDSFYLLLKNMPGVEEVEPNAILQVEPELESASLEETFSTHDSTFEGPYIPNDWGYWYQWNLHTTRADWAWNITKGDSNIVIAIIDSGVDTSHVDLRNNLVAGYNFIDNNTDIQDTYGHGTRVAGVVAAEIDNYEGIAGIAGGCRVMPLRCMDDSGDVKLRQAINAILYAADEEAKIISMSFSGGGSSAERRAIDYAWRKDRFLCASAGNESQDTSHLYPAAYKHVMSVGGSNRDDERWSDEDCGSNYGESVDIYAPGEHIWTTLLGSNYGTCRGTSYSSPAIAGLAALICSVHPEYTNEEVWDAIISSADTIEIDVGKVLRMNCDLFTASAPSIQKDTLSFDYTGTKPTDYRLTFYDVSGRKVYETHGSVGEMGRIDRHPPLPHGVYFWEMRTRFGTGTGKVVYLK